MEQTVRANLELMKSPEEGGMEHLLLYESFGGNAGITEDRRPRAAARFFFDKATGIIKQFGNLQDVPGSIKSDYTPGMFRVALAEKSEIVGSYYSPHDGSGNLYDISETPGISDTAVQALQMGVNLYNA
jgi:hypothetical protein